jgi:formate dehydrogenase subunit gamma
LKGEKKAASALPVAPHQKVIDEVIQEYAALPGPLLVILHAVQDRIGFVPPEALPHIAQALNISRAEVHGVVTFYHDFRTSPPGQHVVRLCQAEACQSMGSETLAAHARARLGLDFHQTSANGAMTLEPVYCLGNCACAPALTVDGLVHGRMTAERFDRLVESLEKPA